MADDRKKIIVCRCPSCFAGDLETNLGYDEKENEYFCRKCCYTGSPEEIEEFFNSYIPKKYKDMAKPHSFRQS